MCYTLIIKVSKVVAMSDSPKKKKSSIWDVAEILDDQGIKRDAQAPVVISASRSTDIPAFYADWFMERLKKGYIRWTNPFNNVPLYVSFTKARMIVFWSKNPKPMLAHLDDLDTLGLHYYFQFTLNAYDDEKFEPSVPPVAERIATFKALSAHVGRNRVIWRFDPLLLTDKVSVRDLLAKAKRVGNELAPYTSHMVFSFADIDSYGLVRKNLESAGILAREFTDTEMNEFAAGLAEFNKKWQFHIGTCAEAIDLAKYGIEHNRCVDDRLMAREFGGDKALMDFLGYSCPPQYDLLSGEPIHDDTKSHKDKGQRKACGCVASKDIGEYSTCPHLCRYCYANTSPRAVQSNFARHQQNPHSDSITGRA